MSAEPPDHRPILEQHFSLTADYASLHDAYVERGVSTALDEGDKEMHGTLDHYLAVGADAVRLVVQALVSSGRHAPTSILDFPSGSGRVTRHFAAFFPEAAITACDLYPSHVDFCMATFGVDGAVSTERLGEVRFGRTFDLIFCGSLITHLPAQQTREAIDLIVNSLSPNGIAVITLHGRQSLSIQQNESEYVDAARFAKIERQYRASGYGYVDYESGFRSQLFSRNARYGISVAKPSWTMSELERHTDIRILGYIERGWDHHQDVVAIGRPNHVVP